MEFKKITELPRFRGNTREYLIAKEIYENMIVGHYVDIETEYPKTLSMALIRMSKETGKKFSVGKLDKNIYRVWRKI